MIEYLGKNRAKLVVSFGSGKDRKRHTKTVTYNKKSELKKIHDDFVKQWKRNPMLDSTVSELVDAYIKSRRVLGNEETTLQGYVSTADRINSLLGNLNAGTVTPYQVQTLVNSLGEKYKPKTIRNTISLLSASYDNAVRLGQLSVNPCKMVELPKNERKEIDIFDKEQIILFLQTLENERIDYIVAYKLALFCGLRRSEILALTEEDVNIPFKSVSVSRSRHRVSGKDYIQKTKTEGSRRTLAVPDFVIEDIKRLIEEHHSKEYEVSNYLIQDGFGKMLTPSALTQRIYYIEERAGLPRVSLHDLRHTFASMLNNSNVDIAMISRELGHSNISTTLNIYTHVFGNVTDASRSIAENLNSEFCDPKMTLEKEKNA